MNVFVLDGDMYESAKYTCDKHVVKMITEHVQLLNTTYFYCNMEEFAPYKLSHQNHPIAKWLRTSLDNWLWLRDYTLILYNEYKFRFENREHRAGEICKKLIIPNIESNGFSEMPLSMPDEYKVFDDKIIDNQKIKSYIIESYRNYYNGEKQHILKYTKRNIPEWISVK